LLTPLGRRVKSFLSLSFALNVCGGLQLQPRLQHPVHPLLFDSIVVDVADLALASAAEVVVVAVAAALALAIAAFAIIEIENVVGASAIATAAAVLDPDWEQPPVQGHAHQAVRQPAPWIRKTTHWQKR
jgi:hypothetical protein